MSATAPEVLDLLLPLSREISEKIHRFATPAPSESIDFVVETPGAKRPVLFVTVSYDKGHEYHRRRGFYMSLIPGERGGGFNTYHIMEGIRVFLSPAPIARVSKKAKTEAIAEATPSLILRPLETVLKASL